MGNILVEYNKLCKQAGVCPLGKEKEWLTLYDGKPVCDEERFRIKKPKLYEAIKDAARFMVELRDEKIAFTIKKTEAIDEKSFAIYCSDNAKLLSTFCITIRDIVEYIKQRRFNKVEACVMSHEFWSANNSYKLKRVESFLGDQSWEKHIVAYASCTPFTGEPYIEVKDSELRQVIKDMVFARLCYTNTTSDCSPVISIVIQSKPFEYTYDQKARLHKMVMQSTDQLVDVKEALLKNFLAFYQEKFLEELHQKIKDICRNSGYGDGVGRITFPGKEPELPKKLNFFRNIKKEFAQFILDLGKSDAVLRKEEALQRKVLKEARIKAQEKQNLQDFANRNLGVSF